MLKNIVASLFLSEAFLLGIEKSMEVSEVIRSDASFDILLHSHGS